MKKKNKKTFSKIKIIFTIFILFLLSGVGVMAVTTKVNSVEITLSDGYQMTVLTTKTKVSDILKENNIIIKEDEKVSPKEDERLTENGAITISDKSKQEVEVAKVSESGVETTLNELMGAYNTIVEKIVEEEEEIPYETIKKDVSKGASSTKNKVVQEGEKGIKKVTYKVKYQNNTQIAKTKISEKIIKKPVNKIVQVNSVMITSRADDSMSRRESYDSSKSSKKSKSGSSVKIYKVTAYCSCPRCCGRYASGRTASGTRATAGRTVAASSSLPFGTKLLINGKQYVVEDRGGAIKGNRIDVYMNSHSKALAWGVKYLPVQRVN